MGLFARVKAVVEMARLRRRLEESERELAVLQAQQQILERGIQHGEQRRRSDKRRVRRRKKKARR